jgi:hypothetical protein
VVAVQVHGARFGVIGLLHHLNSGATDLRLDPAKVVDIGADMVHRLELVQLGHDANGIATVNGRDDVQVSRDGGGLGFPGAACYVSDSFLGGCFALYYHCTLVA